MSSIQTDMNELYKNVMATNEIKMVEWLFFGFILVGIVIKVFTFNLYSTVTPQDKARGVIPVGPATGSVWGYSIILFAVLGLIFISVNPNETNMNQIKNIPYGLYAIVIILLWSIVLNVRFYSILNSSQVMPSQYNVWNNWSIVTIVLLSAFSAVEYFIKRTGDNKLKALSGQVNIYSVIVFFAAIIVIGIQQSILDNFLVDG